MAKFSMNRSASPVENGQRVLLPEERLVDRAEAEPEPDDEDRECGSCGCRFGKRRLRPPHSKEFHRLTSTTVVAVRPKTSGSYISSACVGAAMNVPAVVARTRYVNRCSPSPSLVAKTFTRSS